MDPDTGAMIRDEGEGYRQLFTPAWAGTAGDQPPISPIPPRPGGVTSHVAFPLAAGFRRFRGTAAISDALQAEGSRTPLVFRVVGDGQPLWKSAPLQKRGAQESFDVDVSGVETLHLLTDCEGDDYGAWAVWLATRLVPADEAVQPAEAPSTDASGVYLTELRPQDIVATDPFTAESFATKVATDFFDTKWAGSLPAEHAIWAAPLPNKVSSHVAFQLRRGCERFTGRAAMSDLTAGGPTPVTFRVIGNGRELWRSKPLKDRGASEAFDPLRVRRLWDLNSVATFPTLHTGVDAFLAVPAAFPGMPGTQYLPHPRPPEIAHDRARLPTPVAIKHPRFKAGEPFHLARSLTGAGLRIGDRTEIEFIRPPTINRRGGFCTSTSPGRASSRHSLGRGGIAQGTNELLCAGSRPSNR